MVLHILGAVADFERGLNRERSMTGWRAAMARGILCGRPRVGRRRTRRGLVRLHDTEWFTIQTLADVHGASLSVVKRAIYQVQGRGIRACDEFRKRYWRHLLGNQLSGNSPD